MKKKIKDLTIEEINNICTQTWCDKCPLFLINTSISKNTRICVKHFIDCNNPESTKVLNSEVIL